MSQWRVPIRIVAVDRMTLPLQIAAMCLSIKFLFDYLETCDGAMAPEVL